MLILASKNSYGNFFQELCVYEKLIETYKDTKENIQTNLFKRKYGSKKVVSTLENRSFMQGINEEDRLYVDLESAVLKSLNTVMEDKDFVTSLDYFIKNNLKNEIERDPFLSQKIDKKYSDYKNLRLSFKAKDENEEALLIERLETIYQNVAKLLESKVISLNKSRKYEDQRGLTKSPKDWFLIGVGRSADEAAYAARESRTFFQDEKLGINNFNDSVKARAPPGKIKSVLKRVSNLKDMQQDIQKALEKIPGHEELLIDVGNGIKVISEDLIDLYRKAHGNNNETFLLDFKTRILNRFNVDIDLKDLQKIKDYLTEADIFSPPIFMEERVIINMNKSTNGNISADITGMGAINIFELVKSLAITKGKNPKEVLADIRKSEIIATERMREIEKSFKDFVVSTNNQDPQVLNHIDLTGDDIMFFPKSGEFTKDQKVNFIDGLAKSNNGNRFRMVFVPQNKTNGKMIKHNQRMEHVVRGENLEKGIRAALDGKIPYKRLKKMMFGIDLEIDSKNNTIYSIIIGNNSLNKDELLLLKKAASKILKDKSFNPGKTNATLGPINFVD